MDLPLHPKIVHLPIALAALMPMISVGLWLAWWRGALPRRAWLIVVALQTVLLVSGFAALRSGEQDEERVEAVVPEAAIEAHEEAAEGFMIAAGVVLVVAAAAAGLRNERAARAAAAGAVLGTMAVLGLGVKVGDAGGRLVYEHGAAAAFAPAGGGAPLAPGEAPRRHDDDDDDD